MEVAATATAHRRQATAGQAKHLAAGGAGRNADQGGSLKGRNPEVGAEHNLWPGQRNLAEQVGAAATEQGVLLALLQLLRVR